MKIHYRRVDPGQLNQLKFGILYTQVKFCQITFDKLYLKLYLSRPFG